MLNIVFHPKLLLRAPVRPIDMHFTRETLVKLLDDPGFLESIYIASPVLHNECIKWKTNPGNTPPDREQKLFVSLAKYYTRMCTRTTPFGLFSGCTAIEWKEKEDAVADTILFQRHTRLDMHCLCLLSEWIARQPFVKTALQYRPNNSIYRLGQTIRYMEYVYQEGYRKYQISSVPFNQHIQSVLTAANTGAGYEALVKILKLFGSTRQEAIDYIDQLIASQLLVSNLEPAITGGDPLNHIITTLKALASPTNTGLSALIQKLEQIAGMIEALDQSPVNETAVYKAIAEKLAVFELPFEPTRLFQVDLVNAPTTECLSAELQQKLATALAVCSRWTESSENKRLKKFRRALQNRYGTQEKPLLEMLDEECGIGYSTTDTDPATHDTAENPATEPGTDHLQPWSAKAQLLFNKVMIAAAAGNQTINLDAEELNSIEASTPQALPPSMALVFRCFKDANDSMQLYFQYAYGSSAVNPLARFAYCDPTIKNWCTDVAAQEEQTNSNVLFAEIVHLPECRVGNILLHPAFRKKEIPYLARPAVACDDEILPANLLVSVKNGGIQLRDKLSGQSVIPRLSSAHNYSLRALPFYCFMGDLQHQNLQPQLSFSWGPLYNLLEFLPRVSCQGIVLYPATWKIGKKEFSVLFNNGTGNCLESMQQFIHQFKLPVVFLLADGDNELTVFSFNELSVLGFIDTIKNRNTIVLQEIPGLSEDPQAGHILALTRQYIAAVVRPDPVYRFPAVSGTYNNVHAVQRNFAPASEWIYYKLYCNEKQADKVLSMLVFPIIQEIKQKRIADNWFFIRYADPDFHIRLRFHSADPRCIPEIIALVAQHLATTADAPVCWKIQLDTYTREIERYGAATITSAETIFCLDSDAVLAFLQQRTSSTDNDLSYHWLMIAINDMLSAFTFSLHDKQQLLQSMHDDFARELNVDKPLLKQIDLRYRSIRQKTESLLSGDRAVWTEQTKQKISKRMIGLQQEAVRLQDNLKQNGPEHTINDLLKSFIHMTCNRVFISEARKQEFVVYDFLLRYYRSQLARQKQNDAGIY